MGTNVLDFPNNGKSPEQGRVIVQKSTAAGKTGPVFVTLEIPAFFPVERLGKFFGECGYRMHSTTDGTIRVMPHAGVYKTATPAQRFLSHFGVALPHNRWRNHLLRMRKELAREK